MGINFSKLIKLNEYHFIGFSSIIMIVMFIKRFIKSKKLNKNQLLNIGLISKKDKSGDRKRVGIDKKFLKSIFHFLKFLIPHAFTQEVLLIGFITMLIIVRIMCDIWVVSFTSKIESFVITRQKTAFYKDLKVFLLVSPSIALINNLIRFGINRLKLRFRTRLTNYFYDKYMKNHIFYQLLNCDNRIENVDQLLTNDIDKFSNSLVELYSYLCKPILDIMIYAHKLYKTLGVQGPGYLLFYLLFSGGILTKLRQPLTRMIMMEQQYEGEYRFVNSRLITNSEEIAFYNGNKKEKGTIKFIFQRLRDHLENLMEFRFCLGIVEGILTKYLATTVGLFSISRLFFKEGKSILDGFNHSQMLQYYYSNGRMMIKMSQAVGQLVLSGRQLTSLVGFTLRIQQLDDALNGLSSTKKISRLKVADSNKDELIEKTNVLIEENVIRFDNVPIITPNGDVLIEKISFEVRSGCNVLICGPNGCGKSSLFRILSGLWPQFGGQITKPKSIKLFYIPQKPYMTIGSLRDQIIYPDSIDLMKAKGYNDDQILSIMTKVELEYIVTRESGWDSLRDWSEVLSGGEKQRVAMARLFYHKPKFAILDECTSAVSVDVEAILYSYCREIGITLFTVSHRKSLWKHHEYCLYMDGKGGYEFKRISDDIDIFGS